MEMFDGLLDHEMLVMERNFFRRGFEPRLKSL